MNLYLYKMCRRGAQLSAATGLLCVAARFRNLLFAFNNYLYFCVHLVVCVCVFVYALRRNDIDAVLLEAARRNERLNAFCYGQVIFMSSTANIFCALLNALNNFYCNLYLFVKGICLQKIFHL